jgi:hypothetical protein
MYELCEELWAAINTLSQYSPNCLIWRITTPPIVNTVHSVESFSEQFKELQLSLKKDIEAKNQ